MIWLFLSVALAAPIKVGLVDSSIAGLAVFSPQYSSTEKAGSEHGTAMASIIILGDAKSPHRVCSDVELHSCDYTKKGVAGCVREFSNFDYINISLEGPLENSEEERAIKKALGNGATFTVAAGNAGVDIEMIPVYPASYMYRKGFNSKFIVVSGSPFNWGKGVLSGRAGAYSYRVDGSVSFTAGSSSASALFLHTLLRAACDLRRGGHGSGD